MNRALRKAIDTGMEHISELISDLDAQINEAWSEVIAPGDKLPLRMTLTFAMDKDDPSMLRVDAKVVVGRVTVGAESSFLVGGVQLPLPIERAVRGLHPAPGSGIDSVEITSRGQGVRLNADGTTEQVGA